MKEGSHSRASWREMKEGGRDEGGQDRGLRNDARWVKVSAV